MFSNIITSLENGIKEFNESNCSSILENEEEEDKVSFGKLK
jgi:hypothetical protein